MLILQCRYRHNIYAVRSLVCRVCKRTQHNERFRRYTVFLCRYFIAQVYKFPRRLIYLICAKLNLYCCPATVRHLHNRVYFTVIVILIMVKLPPERFGLYFQIAFTQRLEQEP